jgi:hypothetical protein
MATSLQLLREQILANARELHFFSFPADRPYTHFEVSSAISNIIDEHRAIVTKSGPGDNQIEVYFKIIGGIDTRRSLPERITAIVDILSQSNENSESSSSSL